MCNVAAATTKAEIARIERHTVAIRALTVELKADNDAAERAAVAQAHANLERELRRFMEGHKSYGTEADVCNLLSRIANICAEQSQVEGDDWQTTAEHIDDCVEACSSLEYAEPPHRTDCDDQQTQEEAMRGQRP